MKQIFKNIKSWIVIAISFSITLVLIGTIYATWVSMPEVHSWDPLTATSWNNLLSNIELLRNSQVVLAWWVLAFNLDECPTWWLPANGNGSIKWKNIPDLRWKFIRWLNSFENWSNKLTWTNSDEDGVSRTLGSYQGDGIRDIVGYIQLWNFTTLWGNGVFAASNSTQIQFASGSPNYWTSSTQVKFTASNVVPTWSDNRPKNLALIYCIKE
jgi:hypothetical protein